MPIFRLDPVEQRTADARWASTSLHTTCWVVAASETAARRQVALATAKVSPVKGRPATRSPWLDRWLADCRPDTPRFAVEPDHVVTRNARTARLMKQALGLLSRLPDAVRAARR
jgi:hypothetical protein